MSALRIVLAIAIVATMANATCVAPTGNRFYGNSSIGCTAAVACHTTYCSCIGGSVTTPWLACSGASANCSVTTRCIGGLTRCLNGVATGDSTCTNLRELKMSIMTVNSGAARFNASMAYMNCKYQACVLLNATAGSSCTKWYGTLCPSPVVFIGTTLLRGFFAAILANAASRARFVLALQNDLSRFLRVVVRILRLWIHGTPAPTRTPRAADTLVVEFEAAGVSGSNADFAAQLTALKSSDSSWLAETSAEYTALNPNGGSLTFAGVSAGGISSAFSSRGGLSAAVSAVVAAASSTSTTASTTASPSSGSTTTAATATGAGMTTAALCLVATVLAVLMA